MNRPHVRFTQTPGISIEIPGDPTARTRARATPEHVSDVLQRVMRQIGMRRAAHKLSHSDRRRLLNAARRRATRQAARLAEVQP